MSNVKGIIKVLSDVNQITDSFRKRELVLTVPDEKYPQDILVEFQQDNCSKLDSFGVGQEVSVEYNLRGRMWHNPKTGLDVYFNTIVGWKIDLLSAEAAPAGQDDDLPF